MYTECTCQCAPSGHDHLLVCAHTAFPGPDAPVDPLSALPVCGPCSDARQGRARPRGPGSPVRPGLDGPATTRPFPPAPPPAAPVTEAQHLLARLRTALGPGTPPRWQPTTPCPAPPRPPGLPTSIASMT
ncbi:hypothetical protein KNE206_78440 [Kitasatospora sp. NE20-6]